MSRDSVMADVASSRIFVRGLPPTISQDDFKAHFGKRYHVTDARLLPHRRIGYVGFKTPQDATSAVKYFNKSFIRMSKIFVELAHAILPINESKGPLAKQTNSKSADSVNAHSPDQSLSLKRKRAQKEEVPDDPRLQEYLGLTKPVNPRTLAEKVPHNLQATAQPNTVNSSREESGKSTSDDNNEDAEGVQSSRSTKESSLNGRAGKDHDVATVVTTLIQEQDVPAPHENAVETYAPGQGGTDEDWMRSRTSRLLGLVDDDDHVHVRPDPRLASQVSEEKREDIALAPEVIGAPADSLDKTDSLSPLQRELEPEALTADANVVSIQESSRLFLRNLPYDASEDDLRPLFSEYGPLSEVYIPLDNKTGVSKGFAFVQFESAEHAVEAYQKLDGLVFQGRLLHIIPASKKRDSKLDEVAISKLPLKTQRQIQKRSEASSSSFNWNSLYMKPDAVVSSIAERLGISKSEILDPSSSEAAVKQAQAETHVIQETKAYFEANRVDLDSFKKGERSETAILVKNFSFGTKAEELKTLFKEHGEVTRVLMPPSGTIAIVEMGSKPQSRAAFGALAYRKHQNSVLFLERAPKDIFKGPAIVAPTPTVATSNVKPNTSDLLQSDKVDEDIDTSTLFVRNLNFLTTNDRFAETFKALDGFVSATVKTKSDPKRPGQTLSMGFGFLEFRTKDQAKAALTAMNGYNLDGHELLIKASHKGLDAGEQRRKEDKAKRRKERSSKIIIKNLPFEASKRDITALFRTYGQLRAVRVPKKFDNTRKGFAFAEFTSAKEAENAMDALRNTHLLGRRLVLDFAAGEADDPEKEIEKMQQKVGRQTDSMAIQRLTASQRKKFVVNDEPEE